MTIWMNYHPKIPQMVIKNLKKGLSQKKVVFPSSMGLSFLLTEEAKSFQVTSSWGEYIFTSETEREREEDSVREFWQRVPNSIVSTIELEKLSEKKIRYRSQKMEYLPIYYLSKCKSTSASKSSTSR